MTDKPPIADAIAAVRGHANQRESVRDSYPEGSELWREQRAAELALRAAIDYLSDHERVVAALDNAMELNERLATENDAARAELADAQKRIAALDREGDRYQREIAEARAEIERLKGSNDERRSMAGGGSGGCVADDRGRDAAQAGPDLSAPPPEDAMEAAGAFMAKWKPYVANNEKFTEHLARALTAAREAEREKYRVLVEAIRRYRRAQSDFKTYTDQGARDASAELDHALAALDPPQPEETGCADDCAHPSHGHRR